MESTNSHYGASYFAWQRAGGRLGGDLDRWKFEPFIDKEDSVLDFGCGGGYLLAALDCKTRFGIDVNPVARAEAAHQITAFSSVSEIPDDILVDVVISNHALEHVDDPLSTLRALRSVLKPGGVFVGVVPSETWFSRGSRFRSDDVNQHLYTWTPMLLGNLFTRAGFSVKEASLLCHRWIPKAQAISKVLPESVFDLSCRLWSALIFSRQVRVVAYNPEPSSRAFVQS